ncbi:MAG TPA: FAD-binding oxidoreductase [Pseudonocardia sp.]|jgi:FAD/FMN-containing dehydrogenase|nr:FAD-binding oxidoreductase [Pseudonocardia sp.]
MTTTAPAPVDAAELRARLAGPVLTTDTPGYDEVRRVWNGAIDRRPAVIARCTSAADVAEAIRFARRHRLPIAVRGGGHSIPGLSVCDDGLLVDLQLMKGIEVDPHARTATAEPGVVWAEMDRATQEHGLAVTGGEVSDTGIAGLTLGGGFGWLKRTCGLTCDNLLAAEMVTADGRVVRASAEENADLFWALRGGGGNFGVVTRFTYRLHEVGPILYGGAVVHPVDRAADALRFLRDLSPRVPHEVSLMAALVVAPPAPEFPAELQGRPVVVLGACYHGDLAEGERALAPVRAFAPPAVDLLGPIPYVALQQMIDAETPRGQHYYVKSEWLGGLPDGVVDRLVEHHLGRPSPRHQILVHQMGGAVAAAPRDATAFAYRDASFVLTVIGSWQPGDEGGPHVAWVRSAWEASLPGSLGGAYVNHLDADEGEERVRDAYGPATYDRLVRVKTAWDPDNVFARNHNIRPR